MSAYYVSICVPSGLSWQRPADTLDEAIEAAKIELAKPGHRSVMVCGDGAEGGYGDDGTGWWDGLTDDERESVEAAGVL